MSHTFGPKQLRLVEHNPLVLAAAAVPLLLSGRFLSAVATRGGAQLFILGIILLLWAYRRKPWARYRAVTVGASERGLELGERRVPAEQVGAAILVPRARARQACVRVTLRGHHLPLDIAVTDVAEGRALLRAMGRDATRAAASFLVGSGTRGNPKRLAIAGLAVLAAVVAPSLVAISLGIFTFAAFAAPLGMLAFVALLNLPARLVIGADGISYRWLFSRRFIPYADVAAVASHADQREESLDIVLQSDETLRIPVGSSLLSAGSAAAIEERVDEALDAWRRGVDAGDEARLLRGARAVPDWIRALRAVGAGADAGPREAPLPRDRLWRIIEDPRADQAARAAAAVALAGEEGERDRLRAVAGATAAPRLRVAIEAAAGADDAAIGEALAAVEEEEGARRLAR
jgi:hypothetical protein